MALQKFLALVSGRIQQLSPVQSSAGSASAGDIVALNSAGQIDPTMLGAASGEASISATASEAISAGAIVNVYNNAGTVSVRNADNTAAGKEATGFALAAIASGATGTVTLQGVVTGLSGLTPGAYQFLGTVGALVSAPPSTSGSITQIVGTALSATSVMFRPSDPITN
ncbi:hypothetical protein [Acidiphilium multivorum]|uniref:hypothetical protein n=1 Tax=Acidiphilium multivorum TaxID=62140 RepID=UPI001B8D77D3|nr:hypothetical protein [Acidiphilium multivorum]MBS3025577.1 hypothetical protein [Acidiphilium multivorum]